MKSTRDEKIKEIEVKIKKIGVIHYFAMAYGKDQIPKKCEDCGEEVTSYSRVFGGKRDKKTNKSKWDFICNVCIEDYKSEDLDTLKVLKQENHNGNFVSRMYKEYKSYLSKCDHCKESFDLYKVSMYNYGMDTFCAKCLKDVHGVDYTLLA